MIVKPFRERPCRDKFEQAGMDAEKRMAFYLDRAFGSEKDVYVFNDLWLTRRDDGKPKPDFAQIDHLVMHRHGLCIIESKSVSAVVRVNARGEWTRYWDNVWHGMPSPIQQAKVQADLLRNVLNAHKHELREMYIFGLMRGTFGSCPIEVFAAISDKGRIERPDGAAPEASKADQIVDGLRAKIARHRAAWSLWSVFRKEDKNHGFYKLTDPELERIKAFLLRQDGEARG